MLSLIDENISNLSQIKGNPASIATLVLHANKISSFTYVQRFTNLRSFDLSSNNISSTQGSGLIYLGKLTTLNLANNYIADIQELPPNLRILDLSYNKLKNINPDTLPKSIISLDLRGNIINLDADRQTFSKFFQVLPNLRRLNGKNLEGGFLLD